MPKQGNTNPVKIDIPNKDKITNLPEPEAITPDLAEVLDGLNPKKREQVIRLVTAQESFSGPIPHPDILRGYEDITPGFAERIVRMAEKEQEHRFNCENKQLECNQAIVATAASESKRGQNYALVIAILFLIGSVALAIFGHDTVASILGGGTLVSIVTVLITGRKAKSNNQPSEPEP